MELRRAIMTMKAKALLVMLLAFLELLVGATTTIPEYYCSSATYSGSPTALSDNSWSQISLSVPADDTCTMYGLSKVTVSVDITHTRDSDLYVYVRPEFSGWITLSENKGGNNTDYANVLFSDDAPDYVSDTNYPWDSSSGYKPASGSFSSNYGQSASTWILQVHDDDYGNEGTINSLTVNYCCGTAPSEEVIPVSLGGTCYSAEITGSPVSILYNYYRSLSMSVPADASCTANGLSSLSVTVDITHPQVGNLYVAVQTPANSWMTLSDSRGGPNADYANVLFSDDALEAISDINYPWDSAFGYKPDYGASFSIFDGQDVAGTWALQVYEQWSDDAGTINSFALSYCCDAPAPVAEYYCSSVTYSGNPVTIDDLQGAYLYTSVPADDTCTMYGLSKVTASVDITHPWDSDLYMYLESPNGYWLELSGGIGGDNDNYANVLFSDDAPEQISDGNYPWSSELGYRPVSESFSMYRGQDIAGTWTLYVWDYYYGNVGTANSFTVNYCCGTAPPEYSCSSATYSGSAATIVDQQDTQITMSMPADDTCTAYGLSSLTASVDVTHTRDSDIIMRLEAPFGTDGSSWLKLTQYLGGSNADYANVLFSDDASEVISTDSYPWSSVSGYKPYEGSFSSIYDGHDIKGTWKLTVWDDVAGEGGTVNSFTLNYCCGTAPQTVAPTPAPTEEAEVPTQYCDDPVVSGSKAITDYAESSLSLTISSSPTCTKYGLTSLKVYVSITHTSDSDLKLTLISSHGSLITLAAYLDGTTFYENFDNVLFSDDATAIISSSNYPWASSEGYRTTGASLSTFDGEDPAGTWYLSVYDDASSDVGTIDGFTIDYCCSEVAATVAPTEAPMEGPVEISTTSVGQYLSAEVTLASSRRRLPAEREAANKQNRRQLQVTYDYTLPEATQMLYDASYDAVNASLPASPRPINITFPYFDVQEAGVTNTYHLEYNVTIEYYTASFDSGSDNSGAASLSQVLATMNNPTTTQTMLYTKISTNNLGTSVTLVVNTVGTTTVVYPGTEGCNSFPYLSGYGTTYTVSGDGSTVTMRTTLSLLVGPSGDYAPVLYCKSMSDSQTDTIRQGGQEIHEYLLSEGQQGMLDPYTLHQGYTEYTFVKADWPMSDEYKGPNFPYDGEFTVFCALVDEGNSCSLDVSTNFTVTTEVTLPNLFNVTIVSSTPAGYESANVDGFTSEYGGIVRVDVTPLIQLNDGEVITISAQSSNTNDGAVATALGQTHDAVTLTWMAGIAIDTQSFYVVGQYDEDADGDLTYSVTIDLVSSSAAQVQWDLENIADGTTAFYDFTMMNIDSMNATAQSTVFAFDSRDGGLIGINATAINGPTYKDVTKEQIAVVLTGPPSGLVVFTVTSLNVKKGYVAYPNALAFTEKTWNQTQYVSITGTNADNGFDPYQVQIDLLLADDPRYFTAHALAHTAVDLWTAMELLDGTIAVTVGLYGTQECDSATLYESDSCLYTFALCEYSTASTVCEPIATSTLHEYFSYVVLEMSAGDQVMFSDDGTGGSTPSTTTTVTFDVAGATSQYVTADVSLLAFDDAFIDGDISETITIENVYDMNVVSGETEDLSVYLNSDFPKTLVAHDNDQAGVVFSYSTCATGYETSEAGRICETFVSLTTAPVGTVTVRVWVDNVALSPQQGALTCDAPNSAAILNDDGSYNSYVDLTFTSADYETEQEVDIQGCDFDTSALTGDQTYTVRVNVQSAPADLDYSALPDHVPSFVNQDSDTEGIRISSDTVTNLDERGGSFELTIGLDGDATSYDVQIPLSVSDATHVKISISQIYFLADVNDWSKVCPGSAGDYYMGCASLTCIEGSAATEITDIVCNQELNCDLYGNDGSKCDVNSAHADPVVNGVLYMDPANVNTAVTVTALHDNRHSSSGKSTVSVVIGKIVSDGALNEVSGDVSFDVYDIDAMVVSTIPAIIVTTEETGSSNSYVKTISIDASYIEYDKITVAISSSDTTEATITNVSPAGGLITCDKTITGTFACAAATVTYTVQGIDDVIDDGDISYAISIVPTMTVGGVDVAMQSATIAGTHKDDDTAGITIMQTSSWDSWKSGTRETSDLSSASYPNLPTITLSNPVTYESDYTRTVDFTVALKTAPVGTVYCDVYTEFLNPHPNGGENRHEAVPTSTSDTGLGKAYSLARTAIEIEDDVKGVLYMGYDDSTSGDGAYMRLAFTAANYLVGQPVSIHGIDDLVDDYTTSYTVKLKFVGTQDTATYNGEMITMPFTNRDNDTASFAVYSTSQETGETYYDYTGNVYIYLKSEPKASVLFVLSASEPTYASAGTTVVSFNADNWYVPQKININGIDNEVAQGDIVYEVTIQIVISNDPDYGSSAENADHGFGVGAKKESVTMVLYDDPDDEGATSCTKGQYGVQDDDTCTYCPAGSFVEISGDKTNCRQCPPGTFGAAEGAQYMYGWKLWDGTEMDPGCMPCPKGFYQPSFGQTQCSPCPAGKYCGPIGAWMAMESALNDSYATNMWSILEQKTFQVIAMDLTVDEEGFQSLLLTVMICFLASLVCFLMMMRFCAKEYNFGSKEWEKTKAFLKKKDTFAAEHQDVYYKDGVLVVAEDDEGHKELPGGVLAITAITMSVIFSIFLLYIYIDFNEAVSQTLLPVDESILAIAETKLKWMITFLSFAGCAVQNNVGVLARVSGFENNDFTYSYECDVNGDLIVNAQMDEDSTVTSTPDLKLKVYSNCKDCRSDANEVYSCTDCTASYARAVQWTVEGTALYSSDNNTVTGLMVPTIPGNVFRGGDMTVEIKLIQATYQDDIRDTTLNGFRLQFSQSDEGITGGFTTNTTLCHAEYGCSFDEATGVYDFGDMNLVKGNQLLSDFIVESSFIDADVTLDVLTFEMTGAVSTQQLYINITPIISWLDLYGTVGGLFGSTAAIFLALMIYYEKFRNPEGHPRKVVRAMSPRAIKAVAESPRVREAVRSLSKGVKAVISPRHKDDGGFGETTPSGGSPQPLSHHGFTRRDEEPTSQTNE